MRGGLDDLPPEMGDRYRGLAGWRGIDRLTQSLRRLAGDERDDLPVLLASRSVQLMKLTARLLVRSCRNVLVTDLDWPGYRDILAAECRRANRTITVVPVRRTIVVDGIGEAELVARLATDFSRHGCGGLFLTAVSNDGVRLPVGRIVETLEAAHQLWFGHRGHRPRPARWSTIMDPRRPLVNRWPRTRLFCPPNDPAQPRRGAKEPMNPAKPPGPRRRLQRLM